MEITLNGDRVGVTLNGTKVKRLRPETTAAGAHERMGTERRPRPRPVTSASEHDDYDAARAPTLLQEVSVRRLTTTAKG